MLVILHKNASLQEEWFKLASGQSAPSSSQLPKPVPTPKPLHKSPVQYQGDKDDKAEAPSNTFYDDFNKKDKTSVYDKSKRPTREADITFTTTNPVPLTKKELLFTRKIDEDKPDTPLTTPLTTDTTTSATPALKKVYDTEEVRQNKADVKREKIVQEAKRKEEQYVLKLEEKKKAAAAKLASTTASSPSPHLSTKSKLSFTKTPVDEEEGCDDKALQQPTESSNNKLASDNKYLGTPIEDSGDKTPRVFIEKSINIPASLVGLLLARRPDAPPRSSRYPASTYANATRNVINQIQSLTHTVISRTSGPKKYVKPAPSSVATPSPGAVRSSDNKGGAVVVSDKLDDADTVPVEVASADSDAATLAAVQSSLEEIIRAVAAEEASPISPPVPPAASGEVDAGAEADDEGDSDDDDAVTDDVDESDFHDALEGQKEDHKDDDDSTVGEAEVDVAKELEKATLENKAEEDALPLNSAPTETNVEQDASGFSADPVTFKVCIVYKPLHVYNYVYMKYIICIPYYITKYILNITPSLHYHTSPPYSTIRGMLHLHVRSAAAGRRWWTWRSSTSRGSLQGTGSRMC